VTGLLVLAAMAVVIGSIMQSATGFGFALVAAPVLFPVLGPKEAIGTLLVLACVGSALILAAERRRPQPLWPDATVIIATSLPGAVGGIAVLRSVDSVTLQYAVTGSVFVAPCSCAATPHGAKSWAVRRGGRRPRRDSPRALSPRRPTRAGRRYCFT